MGDLETTDLVEGDALASPQGDDAHGVLEEERTDDDRDGADAEQPLDDEGDRLEEIERNGKKATIPAWLKPELMMQADYTRKTQELADARRAFEAERAAAGQLGHAELSAHANLNAIDCEIDQFSKVDWNAWQGSDPAAASNAFARLQLLQNARRETLGYLDSLHQQRDECTNQEAAVRREQALAELARDLPDWSPELATALRNFGRDHYGFSLEDLDGIDDARVVKALHAAYQWEWHQTRQRQAERHVAAQVVRPAAKVGGAAPKSGLDDRLSAEEWLRRRNAQLRKRA